MTPARYVPAPPVSPGEVLRKRILDQNITQERLANAMKVSRFTINQIINGRRAITERQRFVLLMSQPDPDLWLNLQRRLDLYQVSLELAAELENLEVLRPPKTEQELFAQET